MPCVPSASAIASVLVSPICSNVTSPTVSRGVLCATLGLNEQFSAKNGRMSGPIHELLNATSSSSSSNSISLMISSSEIGATILS